MKQRLLWLFLLCFRAYPGQAEDLEALRAEVDQSAIVQLEKVLPALPATGKARAKVVLRLGDLYAERARQEFEAEIQSTPQGQVSRHSHSIKSRQVAIQHYEKSLKQFKDPEQVASIKMRLASLYQALNQESKSVMMLNQLVQNPKTPTQIKNWAYLQRAHGYFAAARYRLALADYQKVSLNTLPPEEQIQYFYRKGWASFQLQKKSEAKIHFQKAIALVRAHASPSGQDLFYDYGTLLLKERSTKVTEIMTLVLQAHPTFQKSLTLDLAQESFRLQRFDIAVPLYEKIQTDKDSDSSQRLLAQLRLMIMSKDGNTEAQLSKLQEVLRLSLNCQKEELCAAIKKEIRSFVLQHHRLHKAHPKPTVLAFYQVYLKFYKDEGSLFITAAEVAQYLEKNEEARVLYQEAIEMEKNPKQKELLLKNNLARAQAAGKTNDIRSSYLLYIEQGTDVALKMELSLEVAKIDFQNKNWQMALDRSLAISQDKNASNKTQLASALLVMECLIKLADHQKIQNLSAQYKKQFPQKEEHFHQLYLSARQTQAIEASQNSDQQSESQNYRQFKEIKKLAEIQTNNSEKRVLIQNLIRIGESSQISQLKIEALVLFLGLKGISKSEERQALSKLYLTYIKEQRYSEALKLAQKYNELLKISFFEQAQLADISGQAQLAKNLYLQTLQSFKSTKIEKGSAAARLVEMASLAQKVKTLKLYEKHLKLNPARHESILLSLMAQNPQDAQKLNLPKAYAQARRQQTHIQFFYQLQKDLVKKDRSILDLQGRYLNRRVSRLNQLDQWYQKALNLSAPSLQIALLISMEQENRQIVEDLAKIKIPSTLSVGEQNLIRLELQKKSRPFLEKSLLAKNQIPERTAKWNQQLTQTFSILREEELSFTKAELQFVGQWGRQHQQSLELLESNTEMLERRKLWTQLKRQNHSNDENFIRLEAQFGNPILAQLLKQRSNQN